MATVQQQRVDAARQEKLKDRQAYRQTLIQRRADIDARIATVEKDISVLRKG